MYWDCSMERVLASVLWWMCMPRTQDTIPRSEDLKWVPMESWIESKRCSLFLASNLSSTYMGMMTIDCPCSKTKNRVISMCTSETDLDQESVECSVPLPSCLLQSIQSLFEFCNLCLTPPFLISLRLAHICLL